MTAMHPSLAGLAHAPAQEIEAFLSSQPFPLIDPDGVTFVYDGDAEEVRLQHWIYGLPSSQALERLPGTRLWHLRLELPRGSRIEYKLDILTPTGHEWITDPLNPDLASDPFGANSICCAYGYQRPEWTAPDSVSRTGSLEQIEIDSRVFGEPRAVQVYLPARFRRSRKYPLLIVHDGSDYRRYASLGTVLDNLIHRLEIAPMVVALCDPGDRLTEYGGNARHAEFLAKELYPACAGAFPLADEPAARGLMGASFGAIAALHAAWSFPGFFGRLLLQSGSFAFTDIGQHGRGAHFDSVVDFVNALRQRPGRPSRRIFVSCGVYESLIYENRSLVPLLQAQGLDVRYEEARDGHNWENWRDRLRTGLSWLFPGPLWMVYE